MILFHHVTFTQRTGFYTCPPFLRGEIHRIVCIYGVSMIFVFSYTLYFHLLMRGSENTSKRPFRTVF